MAACGMPNTTQELSSCASARAGIVHLAHAARAVVAHAGENQAHPLLPALTATERNSTSTEGRCRDTGGPPLISTK